MAYVLDFAYEYFFLIVVALGIMLLPINDIRNEKRQILLLRGAVIFTFFVALSDYIEVQASYNPQLYWVRVTTSVICYVLKPVVILCLLLYVIPGAKKYWYTYLPIVLNFLCINTAFFCDWAFGFYADTYSFHRGPLGYAPHIACFCYLLAFVVESYRSHKGSDKEELFSMYIIGEIGVIAGIVETLSDRKGIFNMTLIVGCLFCDLYLYRQFTKKDQLTGLFTRDQFYSNCEQNNKSITAIISVDMNGLKALNDTKGHEEGDKALETIGLILDGTNDRRVRAYRMGGDEFALICRDLPESAVQVLISSLNKKINNAGYSCSIGYGMQNGFRNVRAMMKESDQMMYNTKREYYSSQGLDRRQRND
ncbi:MAG: GGDEF domain-containing protein [Sphaerochaetaceae bacterium]|nr:GGDEF domain-containing protein [Sphaerochaetaceae bacterium]